MMKWERIDENTILFEIELLEDSFITSTKYTLEIIKKKYSTDYDIYYLGQFVETQPNLEQAKSRAIKQLVQRLELKYEMVEIYLSNLKETIESINNLGQPSAVEV